MLLISNCKDLKIINIFFSSELLQRTILSQSFMFKIFKI